MGGEGRPRPLAALEPHLGRTVKLDVVSPAQIPQRDGVRSMRAAPGSDEILQRFAEADVLCLPTTRDACPWVVIEAMASGVPVVSTRIGSIPELVSEGGIVVDSGDVAALRAALEQLMADPSRRASTYTNADYRKEAGAFQEMTKEAIEGARPTDPGVQPRPAPGIQFVGIPEFTDLGTRVSQEISAAIAGRQSVESALNKSQKLAEEIAEEYEGR